ncbi:ABC transporter transmembrane domain-containing protein [Roseobacter litoralis]|uniref:ABC transporter permease-like protein n=1 Tax=Roseobacter litoralis (strain ATCC 49566 / DSM 6996 / JCM 21268 / NBRC 15278 / OCh 149) TaxID=391595 RepID=F7ZEM7_ROSLO|nr:ABC transporter transmembrane domain-containing protein [Roseobacter litoralis]AEI95923.1 ABC transporter permease-like protein [Roseobacter litoralis Och 149]
MTLLPPVATRDRVFDAVLVVSCGIVQAAALAVAAFATRDAFAALHGGVPLASTTMLELALAGALTALCLFISGCRAERLGQSYAIDLRRTLYAKIAQMPKARHEERRVGALSLRFVGDLSAARLWFGRGLPEVLSACVVLPGAVGILYALSPVLATRGLVPLAIALVVMAVAAWHLERRHRRLRQRRAGIAISMIERIAIAPELDVMGRTGTELRRLDAQGVRLRDDAVARRGRTVGLQSLLQAGTAASGLTMLWLASMAGIAPATVAASLSVLALVALPLQHLGAAWDQYCAWRVARGKAQNLLREPAVRRYLKTSKAAVSVKAVGRLGDTPVAFEVAGGETSHLTGSTSRHLARAIAGLDTFDTLDLRFDGKAQHPCVSYIGDDHVGLQGSLRRSVTLMNRKRPTDERIAEVLRGFGLGGLLASGGLDQRLSENGNGLSAAQTLRLDLARAVLGKADVIVIASLRWSVEPEARALQEVLQEYSSATLVLAEPSDTSSKTSTPKVI